MDEINQCTILRAQTVTARAHRGDISIAVLVIAAEMWPAKDYDTTE